MRKNNCLFIIFIFIVTSCNNHRIIDNGEGQRDYELSHDEWIRQNKWMDEKAKKDTFLIKNAERLKTFISDSVVKAEDTILINTVDENTLIKQK